MKKTRAENVAINTVVGLAQRVIVILANFYVQVIFIRLLGIQYAGVSALFTSVLTVLSFTELGIGTAITYNLYKPIADNDEHAICAYINFYAKAYRFIALSVFLLGLLFIPLLPKIVTNVPDIKENITIIYLMFVVDTSVSYLLIYKSVLLTASQQQYVISIIQGILSIVKCVLVAAVLFIWKSYYGFIAISFGITIIQNLIISAKASKKYPFLKKYSDKLDKKETKRIFKNASALLMYKVSGVVLNGTDNIIISGFLGTGYVGILSNYNLIIKQIYHIIMQFFSSTTASVGNLAVEQDSERQHQVFEILNFIAFWCYGFCSIVLFTVINPFIRYSFGKEYLFTVIITSVLIADFYIQGMMSPVTSFRTSNGLFVQGKYRPVCMAIINIITSIVLLRYFGIVGVFIGTVFSRLVTQVWFDPYILYKYVFKRSPWRYYRKYILRIVTIAVLCVVSRGITLMFAVQAPLIEVVVGVMVCLIAPNIVIVALFRKTKEFKSTLQIIKSMVNKITVKLFNKKQLNS